MIENGTIRFLEKNMRTMGTSIQMSSLSLYVQTFRNTKDGGENVVKI